MATQQTSNLFGSKYATWKSKRQQDKIPPQLDSKPTALTGKLILEWELPSRLEGQDIREWVFMGGTLTLQDGLAHFGRLDQQVKEFYGLDGFRVVDALVSALENPGNTYRNAEYQIVTTPYHLECFYSTDSPNFLTTLQATLAWICLMKRNEIKGCLALSRGCWLGDSFQLQPMTHVDWNNTCWSQTLGHAMIACCDDEIPDKPMMLTSFSLAHQLAGVYAPIHVEEGLIWHGGMTALVPINRRRDGKILWHFEGRVDALLKVSEIQCIKGQWYRTLNIDELQSAPVLLGWSEQGSLLLATDNVPHEVTWSSNAKAAYLMDISKPTLQGAVQIPAHLTVTVAATVNSVDLEIKHSLPENYEKFLYLSAKDPWIVYDNIQKRAWLVSAVNLVHHMAIVSQANLRLSLPPYATKSHSSRESLRILLENADYVLSRNGEREYLLRHLVMECILKLNKIDPIPTRHEIIGYDFMEALTSTKKQKPISIPLHPKPIWMRFLSKFPCLIAPDAGELMIAERSSTTGSPCKTLIPGRNYLAVTIEILESVAQISGQRDLTADSWKMLGGYWAPSSDNFHKCDHIDGAETCWEKKPNFLQKVEKKAVKGRTPGLERLPATGIVVFGSKDRGVVEPLLSRLRIKA